MIATVSVPTWSAMLADISPDFHDTTEFAQYGTQTCVLATADAVSCAVRGGRPPIEQSDRLF